MSANFSNLFNESNSFRQPQAPSRQPLISTQPAGPQAPGTLDRVMGILNTPAGAAGIQAAGAGIAAYGANKSATADRQLRAQQFAAEMAQRQSEADQQDQRTRAAGALDASPLGADQQFAQRQALMGAILGNTRNFSATPGDPAVAAAMGSTNQGGMRIPEGGFDPAMLNRLFGDDATLASLSSRQQAVGQLNPRGHATDLSPMFGQAGADTSAAVSAANTGELNRQMDESAKQREIIQRAIDEDIRGEKQKGKGSSIWKKLAKVGLIAGGGIATAMTAGAASPLLLGAIGAGVGAGTGAIDNGWKGALTGGALGAATGGFGGGAGSGVTSSLGSAAKSTIASAAKSQLKNPQIYSAILGR